MCVCVCVCVCVYVCARERERVCACAQACLCSIDLSCLDILPPLPRRFVPRLPSEVDSAIKHENELTSPSFFLHYMALCAHVSGGGGGGLRVSAILVF